MSIEFLGVGSAFAAKNHQTNFIIHGTKSDVFVDFGMTGPRAIADKGIQPIDIECILPTHSHADHVGGIEMLALMNRYVGQEFLGKPKLKMIIEQNYQRILWDYTLRGGLEYNEENDQMKKLNFEDFFDVIRPKWKQHEPREIFEVEYQGINIEIFRTKHIPEQSADWESSFISFGIYLPDEKIFVSGDTRFDPELIEMYAHKSKIMFHDVQFFPGAVHAPLADLKMLDKSIKDKMYLIHYSDDFDKQDISDFAGWASPETKYT